MKCLIFVFLFSIFANAQSTRAFFLAGFGVAQGTSADATVASQSESPGAFNIQIDFPFYSSIYIFAEHFRSLGGTGSSIGFTGAGFKYYPWLNPRLNKKIDSFETSQYRASGFFPFFGVATGVSQASIISSGSTNSNVLAAAGYISGKMGSEYSMGKSWGFSSEINFAMTLIGSGATQAFNMLFGSYYVF